MVPNIYHYASVSSTMDVCHELAQQGAAEGTVVSADAQTLGRGQHDHTWYSPPGENIYASILLRPQCPPQQLSALTMLGAVAVLEVAYENAPGLINLGIKWFNDVMVGPRKLAGVLVENSFLGNRLDYSIIGIGLNINCDFKLAPEIVCKIATSMYCETGSRFSKTKILSSLITKTALLCRELNEGKAELIYARYKKYCNTVGRRISVWQQEGGKVHTGIALEVQFDGSLVLDCETGLVIVRSC